MLNYREHLYLCDRRHYVEATYLQLLERLVTVLYPLSGEHVDSMSVKITELYEMVVSHSAFLQSMLARTSNEVKGEDLVLSNI